MLKINFVPDDYVQNNESRRTNFMYLFLFLVTMVAIGISFTAIRMKFRAVVAKELLVNQKLTETQESIKKFEDLQTKRKEMVKTALMTAELLEPVPRSLLLASLTNNLPSGASLLRIKLLQKEAPKVKTTTSPKPAANAKPAENESPEKSLDTLIDIEGIAPSDLQVAVYIEKLSSLALLDNVALVESKEYKKLTDKSTDASKISDSEVLRQFKLSAILKKDSQITKDEIRKIACDTVAISN